MKTYANSNTKEDIEQLLNILEEDIIVSKTDLKGIITYSSKAFENLSGYNKQELAGSSQSIVKDPDFPKEIFEDIWDTLILNQTWKGEVRNKKKDDNFYWVKVIITPLYENNIKLVI